MADQNPLKLVDDKGTQIGTITTDGHTIKPFLNALAEFVDEAKLHVREDGLHATAVDPANVAMIDLHLPADAFEDYTLEADTTLGVNVGMARHLVRRARMHHDDTLTLTAYDRRLYATVTRGYDDADVVTEDRIDLIDPDAIRAEPDLPNLDVTSIDIGRDAFEDVTEHATDTGEYVEYELVNGDLVVEAAADTMASNARVEGVVPGDAAGGAVYAKSYLTDLLAALQKAKASEFDVALGTGVPIVMEFARTTDDDDVLLSGEMMLAPRIHDE